MPVVEAVPPERLDLHVHTSWSSGFCTPCEVVRWASMGDLTTLAITDHHTTKAYDEARETARALGVTLVPAIELDCQYDGRRVDLLGYWIDPHSPELATFLGQWPGALQQLLSDPEALAAFSRATDIQIDHEGLLALSKHGELGFYHLFAFLVRAGWARSLGAVFSKFEQMRQAGQLSWRRRELASVAAGAAIIRAAGGIVSLAHPGLVRDDAQVRRLLAEGVVDAVEGIYGGYWYGLHERNTHYQTMAAEYRLPISAGSDYHAYPNSDLKIGVEAPAGTLQQLQATHHHRRNRS